MSTAPRVLVIDALDSFTGSLVQQLRQLGAELRVARHALPVDAGDYDLVVLSPGPGRPEDHSAIMDAVTTRPAPIFGVCLGLQAIALSLGARVGPARRIVHGRTSLVHHAGDDVFAGLPSPTRFTRYHSLAVYDLPPELSVTARTADGQVMGIRHATLPLGGVQFHPESVRSHDGLALMANVLHLYARRRSQT